ncbi:MAG: dTDP-glucose 4,6-dehydratase [Thiotrichales bacterium]
MANLLVTGAAGFIGVNFVYYWLRNYPDDKIVGLDALTYAGNHNSVEAAEKNQNFRFVHGDIRDQALIEQILKDDQIDTIVHFAAESHVDRSITGPDAFIDTNIIGTHSMLKAARAVWLDGPNGALPHRFHHVSTDEVYGSLGPNDPSFKESNPYEPNSPYSASKAASDHLVRAYHHTYGLEVTTSNCSNNYGPFQFPEKLIPLVLTNILHGKQLPIYGDGKNIRDWLYVDDHALGIDLILKNGQLGETYNIGGHNEWTNIDIVNLICDLMDTEFAEDGALVERFPGSPAAKGEKARSLITYVKDRPGHDQRYAIDAAKTTAELGYKPEETFETGIRKTVRWYLDNEDWWRAVMDGSYKDWIDQQYAERKIASQ